MKNKIFTFSTALLIWMSCSSPDPVIFGTTTNVTITGYNGNIMEPFITRNGDYLLFNNLNAAPENTNLHYALRISDTEFQYQGEFSALSTSYIEGTPSLDINGNLYFISTRSYSTTMSTIYRSVFGSINSNPELVSSIFSSQPGVIAFDVEVSSSGAHLYFSEGTFDPSGNPLTADLIIAEKTTGSTFARLSNSVDILRNINTNQLEYAAGISNDELELFFTRVSTPINSSTIPRIFMASRKSITEAFGMPIEIKSITGFVEAPSPSTDGKLLYFHRRDGDRYQVYVAKR